MEPLAFNLENFEGPLELLLYLLEKDKISVVDLSIDALTDQYLAWLHKAKEMDMEITSEFILMAAELIRIKLKKLLPKKNAGEEEVDSEKEFVDQLVLYRFHRDQRLFLEKRYEEHSIYLSRTINDEQLKALYRPQMPLKPLPLGVLTAAYDELAASVEERSDVYEVKRSQYTLSELLANLLQVLENERMSLKEIFTNPPTRDFVLDIFLVLLEGMRRGKLEVHQQELFAPIFINKRG